MVLDNKKEGEWWDMSPMAECCSWLPFRVHVALDVCWRHQRERGKWEETTVDLLFNRTTSDT